MHHRKANTDPVSFIDTLKSKYLIFTLDKDSYGIEIFYVREIIGIQSITPVPELPDYMKGVINLRGKIIPLMDVRLRLKNPCREYTSRTCIIIIEVNAISMGLIVDGVSEVLMIPEENIAVPPDLHKAGYIRGIGKCKDSVKLILDCNKLLNPNDEQMMQEIKL